MVKRAEGDKPYLYQPGRNLSGPNLQVAFIIVGVVVVLGWLAFLAILLVGRQPRIEPQAAVLWLAATSLAVAIVAFVVSLIAVRRARRQAA